MSKQRKTRSPEIPLAGGALEIPNYVTPTTDLEYREINDRVDPRAPESGEDRRSRTPED